MKKILSILLIIGLFSFPVSAETCEELNTTNRMLENRLKLYERAIENQSEQLNKTINDFKKSREDVQVLQTLAYIQLVLISILATITIYLVYRFKE